MYNLQNNRTYPLAQQFTSKIYAVVEKLPNKEIYNLASQLRRCANSISANIAEGSSRSNKESVNFLSYSLGSLRECSEHLSQCNKLNYISDIEYKELEDQSVILQKMLYKFMKALEKNND